MIDANTKTGGRAPRARGVAVLVSLVTLAQVTVTLAQATVAEAAVVKFPKARPKVALDVPDDWTIATTATGLEIRSPGKDSIIVAQVIGKDKSLVEAWSKQAGETLKAFGVVFDASPKMPPPTPAPGTAGNTPSAFTVSPDAFTFSGAPSLKTPGNSGSNDAVKPGPNSFESLTSPETDRPKLPFKTVEYLNTTVNGKTVDAELAIYTLPDKHLFVLMQESAPDDNRSVAIAKSVRAVEK